MRRARPFKGVQEPKLQVGVVTARVPIRVNISRGMRQIASLKTVINDQPIIAAAGGQLVWHGSGRVIAHLFIMQNSVL
jgi:hypothetical protein